MYVDGTTIVHVVDVAAGFGNAAVLASTTVEHVWDTFIPIWEIIYPGYPNKLRLDNGTAFISPTWTHCTDASGIRLQMSGVERHNFMGTGER